MVLGLVQGLCSGKLHKRFYTGPLSIRAQVLKLLSQLVQTCTPRLQQLIIRVGCNGH